MLLDDMHALSEATQALKSLVDRLPQAFEQTADVLEMLASQDRITIEQSDPQTEAATTAAELRAVTAGTEKLAKDLSHPASALFLPTAIAEVERQAQRDFTANHPAAEPPCDADGNRRTT
ncbi:hypothetical protein [Streptomyces roseolus]|uniref:hypothetical protein n=1 Tax=Streptomyces roseolus TaxID=67358 RepID=UPI00167C1700|nr:hypothetical protein [Streptomyces roseolus]GGR41535.1 hypothetical protein GCM10010282_37920 [Streptomyces roseolus]